MDAAFPACIFLLNESLKLFDFGFALDDDFLGVGEDIADSRGDKLVEDVKLH